MRYIWNLGIILSILTFLLSGTVRAQQQTPPSKLLVVGTKEAPPFSMKTPDGEWTGISIDLWREIAEELNLNYEFQELDLKQLLEGITNRSLDVAVAALTITSKREKKFDFTHSYFTSGLGIAVVSKGGNPWLAVIRRFMSLAFLKVVATLFIVLLVVGFLAWWFEHKKNPQQFKGDIAKGIGSGLWWSAVTMTTVGYGDKAPITFAGRVVALIWMFVAIIIISSFTAAITSSLTLSKLESVIKGPEDLPKVIVGTIMNTTSESYLKQNRISYLSVNTPREGLSFLKAGKIDALVYDAPILRYYIHRDYLGSLQVLPYRLLQQDYGIALPANSPLREFINVILLQKIQEKAWRDKLFQYLGE